MKKSYKLFHVEQRKSKMFYLKTLLIFFVSVVLVNCGVAKQRIEIQDFIIMPNGLSVSKQQPLNAFVFENDLNNLPIQEFLARYFRTSSLQNKIIDFKLDNSNFKLIIYDSDDFERFFGSNNFLIKNIENNSNKNGNPNKFIAFSVITGDNHDCLDQRSLYYLKISEYLKSLKSKYFFNNGK